MEFAASQILPTILGGLGLTKALSRPKAPEIAKPAVMPTPDDAAVMAAKKRQAAQMQSRSGRESTILTSDTLGG